MATARSPKTKTAPTTKTKKRLTYEDIRRYSIPREFTGRMGTYHGFPGCCGIEILAGLSPNIPAKAQAAKLLEVFGDETVGKDEYDDGGVAMVLISDTVDSTAWKATKEVAKQSKILVNPNSGNKIAFWSITKADCKKIFQYE